MDATFIAALCTMGGLGAFFAAALAVADRKLRVEEDPRIGEVNDVLPGANCGACGSAGCQDFAVGVVSGEKEVNGCPVGGADVAEDVASVMGVDAGAAIQLVARIHCRGGHAESERKPNTFYQGPNACSAAHLVGGAEKACSYGCLGGGECVDACTFGAIYMNENGLPEVIDDLCTGCGACAKACPRGIISIHPVDRDVFIFCVSHDDPKTAKSVCSVACVGCGVCARKSGGAITMDNNLAVIDYDAELDPEILPFEKCKTGAITTLGRRELADAQLMMES